MAAEVTADLVAELRAAAAHPVFRSSVFAVLKELQQTLVSSADELERQAGEIAVLTAARDAVGKQAVDAIIRADNYRAALGRIAASVTGDDPIGRGRAVLVSIARAALGKGET